jgi:hypothetical protein
MLDEQSTCGQDEQTAVRDYGLAISHGLLEHGDSQLP